MFRIVVLLAALLLVGLYPVSAAHGQADIVLKRRTELSDEDLRKQLMNVPIVGLDQPAAATMYAPLKKYANKITALPPDMGPKFFAQAVSRLGKIEQFALPWRMGGECEMGKEAAERLHVLSGQLRDHLRKAVPKGDIRPDPRKLRDALVAEEWRTPQAIPTLMQMLQTENTPIRMFLVELLSEIKGKDASIALTQRAAFDLSAEVREKAVRALAKRPPADYQKLLLKGLQYPWAAAADHCAEAIAALKLTGLVPDMVQQLKETSPNLPVKVEKGYAMRELVRVNHMSNCMVCHAPSLSKEDLVRGNVPMPFEDPPPLYYAERSGLFVRADITFLRQDFSVVQPVPVAGKWPGNQRFDYILRVRPANKTEQRLLQQLDKQDQLPKMFGQREALLFALRQVTKTDAGETYDDWTRELPKLQRLLKEEQK